MITRIPIEPVTHIKQLREKRGISQNELAVTSGIGLSTLRKLENASSHEELALTGVAHFVALARALDCTAVKVYPILGVRRVVR